MGWRIGGRTGESAVALISTIESFFDIYVITTKSCDKSQKLSEKKIWKSFCVLRIRCCHGIAVFDDMFRHIGLLQYLSRLLTLKLAGGGVSLSTPSVFLV